VRFAIRGGRATFGGPRTLVVTTNSAGRAAVATLTPTGSGAFQITATAAFQGQTAAVTIAQTNVMTAAAASGASGGAGAGASGAAGSGGGISATTIGVVGGAVAGGTIVAEKTLVNRGTTYTGDAVGNMFYTFPGPGPSGGCTRTHRHTGTLRIHLQLDGEQVSGTADADGTEVVTASTCTTGPQIGDTGPWGIGDAQLHGTKGSITFTSTETNTFAGGSAFNTWDFAGSLNGDTITGTLTGTRTIQPGGSAVLTCSVTLR
jgi:hypothetical protein